MWRGSWPLRIFCTRSGTTWLMASLTFPDRTSTSPRARPSPTPTQLNGRTIVYGTSYWSPSYDGHESADSNTIDDDRYVTFFSRPDPWAAMAASQLAAMIRSL